MECVRLRVQDVDSDRQMLFVRQAKGGKDRTTVLPQAIQSELRLHLEKVKDLHAENLKNGYGEVYLPPALARKYPSASREFRWQYVFPGRNLSCDPRSGATWRHHALESGLQKAVKAAVEKAGIRKRVSFHAFRHSFATHMLVIDSNVGANHLPEGNSPSAMKRFDRLCVSNRAVSCGSIYRLKS